MPAVVPQRSESTTEITQEKTQEKTQPDGWNVQDLQDYIPDPEDAEPERDGSFRIDLAEFARAFAVAEAI